EAALAELDHFFQFRAESFGRYQDAMLQGEAYLWHSLISPALNLSLLSPRELCDRIQREHDQCSLPLDSADGLLRQVLGWREFIRAISWRRMPELRSANLLGATRPGAQRRRPLDPRGACQRRRTTSRAAATDNPGEQSKPPRSAR